MSTWKSVWRVYLAVLVLAGLSAGLVASGSGGQQNNQSGNQDKKSKVIQIDLSKLPKDLAKELQRYVKKGDEDRDRDEQPKGKKGKGKGKQDEDQKKGSGKKGMGSGSVTLTQAIAIAEKATKGHAYRAEMRTEKTGTTFRVEVQDAIGKRRVDLSASGEVLKSAARERD
jgi:uncharacterized membrane protein YkoI